MPTARWPNEQRVGARADARRRLRGGKPSDEQDHTTNEYDAPCASIDRPVEAVRAESRRRCQLAALNAPCKRAAALTPRASGRARCRGTPRGFRRTAHSRSSRGMLSGGAMRTTRAVRVLRQDAAREQPLDDRARASMRRASTSMPMNSPRPRTSTIDGTAQVAAVRASSHAPSSARALDQVFVEQHVERGHRDRRARADCRRTCCRGRPGENTCITSSVATNADTGSSPPPSALPRITPSGLNALVLAGEELAGAAETGLDFVADQQHVVRRGRSRAQRAR